MLADNQKQQDIKLDKNKISVRWLNEEIANYYTDVTILW